MKPYYRMRQDRNLQNVIQLRDFDICGARHIFHKWDAEHLNQTTVLYLNAQTGEIAPDFIQSPVYMVSRQMKQVLEMYEDDLLFRNVSIIHKEQKKQMMYYQILMDEIEAVSLETERYPDGNEKKLILDSNKISWHKVFLLSDSRMKDPIISLEVAESLMRRGLMGVKLEEIEVR